MFGACIFGGGVIKLFITMTVNQRDSWYLNFGTEPMTEARESARGRERVCVWERNWNRNRGCVITSDSRIKCVSFKIYYVRKISSILYAAEGCQELILFLARCTVFKMLYAQIFYYFMKKLKWNDKNIEREKNRVYLAHKIHLLFRAFLSATECVIPNKVSGCFIFIYVTALSLAK